MDFRASISVRQGAGNSVLWNNNSPISMDDGQWLAGGGIWDSLKVDELTASLRECAIAMLGLAGMMAVRMLRGAIQGQCASAENGIAHPPLYIFLDS